MKKRRQRNSTRTKSNSNQLSFDFNLNQPIEIHTPKSDVSILKRELTWERRPVIEIVKS
jgi:hypothetical protein